MSDGGTATLIAPLPHCGKNQFYLRFSPRALPSMRIFPSSLPMLMPHILRTWATNPVTMPMRPFFQIVKGGQRKEDLRGLEESLDPGYDRPKVLTVLNPLSNRLHAQDDLRPDGEGIQHSNVLVPGSFPPQFWRCRCCRRAGRRW